MQQKRRKSREAARKTAPIPVHVLKGEPNPFEGDVDHAKVTDLTDRVFRSVLGKYGWGQDPEGHIEHIGTGNQPESRT